MSLKSFSTNIGAMLMLLFSLSGAQAQPVAKTGYFMDNATHRHLMNPALTPSKGYIGIPALGSFDLGIQSNMRFTQFIYPGLNPTDKLVTFMHESVSPEQFLNQLDPNNYLRMNQRFSILSFGSYFGNSFWTFEVASRVNLGMDVPKPLFEFLKRGMESTQGNRYEILDLKLGANAFVETAVGASYPIGDQIRVGGKAKLLTGIATAEAGFEEMIIDMRPDVWTVSTKGLINIHGKGVEFEKDQSGIVEGVAIGTPGASGMGIAFDLGASWKPLDFLEVSAGIIDLGKISWKQDHNRIARAQGTVNYTGMEDIGAESESEEEPFDEIVDDLMAMAEFKEVSQREKRSESLSPTLNFGVEGSVLENKVSLGILYSNRMIPGNAIHELTGVVNYRPFDLLNLAVSYSALHGAETFGFALGLDMIVANLFLACDYIPTKVAKGLPIPLNTATTHVQVGLSINLGKMH